MIKSKITSRNSLPRVSVMIEVFNESKKSGCSNTIVEQFTKKKKDLHKLTCQTKKVEKLNKDFNIL